MQEERAAAEARGLRLDEASTSCVAMAASTALPPFASIAAPASAARGLAATTRYFFAVTSFFGVQPLVAPAGRVSAALSRRARRRRGVRPAKGVGTADERR